MARTKQTSKMPSGNDERKVQDSVEAEPDSTSESGDSVTPGVEGQEDLGADEETLGFEGLAEDLAANMSRGEVEDEYDLLDEATSTTGKRIRRAANSSSSSSSSGKSRLPRGLGRHSEERKEYRKNWMKQQRVRRKLERESKNMAPEVVHARKEKARATKSANNKRYYLKRMSRLLEAAGGEDRHVSYANMTDEGLFYRGELIPKKVLDGIVMQLRAASRGRKGQSGEPSFSYMLQPAQVEDPELPPQPAEPELAESVFQALQNSEQNASSVIHQEVQMSEPAQGATQPLTARPLSPMSPSILTPRALVLRDVRRVFSDEDWRLRLPLGFSFARDVPSTSANYCDIAAVYPDNYLAKADRKQKNLMHTVKPVPGNGNCLPASLAEGINAYKGNEALKHSVIRTELVQAIRQNLSHPIKQGEAGDCTTVQHYLAMEAQRLYLEGDENFLLFLSGRPGHNYDLPCPLPAAQPDADLFTLATDLLDHYTCNKVYTTPILYWFVPYLYGFNVVVYHQVIRSSWVRQPVGLLIEDYPAANVVWARVESVVVDVSLPVLTLLYQPNANFSHYNAVVFKGLPRTPLSKTDFTRAAGVLVQPFKVFFEMSSERDRKGYITAYEVTEEHLEEAKERSPKIVQELIDSKAEAAAKGTEALEDYHIAQEEAFLVRYRLEMSECKYKKIPSPPGINADALRAQSNRAARLAQAQGQN